MKLHLGLWGAALTLLVSAAYATHLHFFHIVRGDESSLAKQFLEALVHVGAWALLVPLVLRLGARAPLGRSRLRPIAFHLVAGAIFALAQVLLHSTLDQVLLQGTLDAGAYVAMASRTFYANVLIYFAIVVTRSVYDALLRRETQTERLQSELAHAQLDALRNRLHPHFLFNALNSIAALIRSDPGSAELVVMRLSQLLRAVLRAPRSR